jgi:DHA2 family multidrug resistance protein-like MFS transporter
MLDGTPLPEGTRAGTREWVGLAVLALPTLLVSIDVSVILLALPHISASLEADSTQMLWIMDIYGFLLAGFMITMGTLGDRIGRRKLLMIGGTAFAGASILAAFSPTAELLIISRALLGVAGATITPSAMALITNMFRNEAQRGTALSIFFTCFMGGMALGPVVGGVMLEWFWWGSVFLIGVPVMVLLLALAPALLPEFRDRSAGRLDLISVALSLLTTLPVVYGLKEIAKAGIDVLPLISIAAGLIMGTIFILRQRRLDHPLLDLKLLTNPRVATAIGGMAFVASTGALMLFTNQYMQLVAGLSPLQAGLWTLPGVAASVVGFMLSPALAQRIPPARLIAAGLAIAVAGAVVVAQAGDWGLYAVIIGFVAFNGGCAPMVVLANGIVMTAVAPERAGAAAALTETSAETGFALGIAVLGSAAAAMYRTSLDASLPAGLPAQTVAAAHETLASALAVAATLPAETATLLEAAARSAFMGGMQMAVTVVAIILAGVGLTVLTQLRHLRPLSDGTAAHPAPAQ